MTDKQREEWIEKFAIELADSIQWFLMDKKIQIAIQPLIDATKKALRCDEVREVLNEAPMRKPKASREFVEEWAKEIVERIFSREYVQGNSQTLKVLCRMLIKAGVEVEE